MCRTQYVNTYNKSSDTCLKINTLILKPFVFYNDVKSLVFVVGVTVSRCLFCVNAHVYMYIEIRVCVSNPNNVDCCLGLTTMM